MAAHRGEDLRGYEYRDEYIRGVAYNAQIQSIGSKKGEQAEQFLAHDFDATRVKIINNSYGTTDTIKNFEEWLKPYKEKVVNSIKNNDQVFVYSTGNDGVVAGGNSAGEVVSEQYLFTNNSDNSVRNNVLVVGSVDDNTIVLSDFSNILLGLEKNTVLAPGNAIRVADTTTDDTYDEDDGKYDYFFSNCQTGSGTSLSAPAVSGTLALISESMPYLTGKQLVDTVLTTANNDFTNPEYIFHGQITKDGGNTFKIIRIDNSNPVSEASQKEVLRKYFFATADYNEEEDKYILLYGDKVYTNFDEFAAKVLPLDVIDLTREQVYGQGILDAGKAVQGPGAFDAERLEASDTSNKYTPNNRVYLYDVYTGDAADNYKNRQFSIWSNDIAEKKAADGFSVGLCKTGPVDLILLGENTYEGPTVVKSGNLQIIKKVSGDVYAGDNVRAAHAEINGAANNVYSLCNSDIVIKDTDVNVKADGYDGDVQNSYLLAKNMLPSKTAVNIDGGLFAIGKDTANAAGPHIPVSGATIDVNLANKDSLIKGAIFADDLGKINVTLNNGATLVVEDHRDGTPIAGYYDGTEYSPNNNLADVSLSGDGTIDLSHDKTYQTLTIDNLSGDGGLFSLNTDVANNLGDKLEIKNGTAGTHYLAIHDKDCVDAALTPAYNLEVAVAPSQILFVPNQVDDFGDWQVPKIDSITDDTTNTSQWYFYGYEGVVNNPYDDTINSTGIFTTDDILNNGITATTPITLKVLQGTAPALTVKKDVVRYDFRNVDNIYVVSGPIKFIGNGPVRISATVDDGKYEPGDLYGSSLVGIGVDEDQNLAVRQALSVDVDARFLDIDSVGIENKSNSRMQFDDDVDIYSATDGNPFGVKNQGSIDVAGSASISLCGAEGKIIGIVNQGVFNVAKDLSVKSTADHALYGGSSYSVGVDNQEKSDMNVGGSLDVLVQSGTSIRNAGSIDIVGNAVVNGGGSWAESSIKNTGDLRIQGDLMMDGIQKYAHFISNEGNFSILGNVLLAGEGDAVVNSGDFHIYNDVAMPTAGFVNEGTGSVIIDGNLNAKSISNSEDGKFQVGGTLEVDNGHDIQNHGSLQLNAVTAPEGVNGEFVNTGEVVVATDVKNLGHVQNYGDFEVKGGLVADYFENSSDSTHLAPKLVAKYINVDTLLNEGNVLISEDSGIGHVINDGVGTLNATTINGDKFTNYGLAISDKVVLPAGLDVSKLTAFYETLSGELKNTGKLEINTLTASKLTNAADGRININSALVTGILDNRDAVTNITSLEAEGAYISNDGGVLNLNDSGMGTVKIRGRVYTNGENDGETNINLNNSSSYVKGIIHSSTRWANYFRDGQLNISVSNGGLLEVDRSQYNDMSTPQSVNHLELSDGGILHLTERRHSTYDDLYVDTLSGNNGIINFDIVQDSVGSGNITSSVLHIISNFAV